MKTLRSTKNLRTVHTNGDLYLIQLAHKAHTGRPRTNSPTRFRVFHITESARGTFLDIHWIGSTPTLKLAKALILDNQTKKDSV